MNTAETTVYTNPALQPGVLAPITRIGGGELRVNRALKSPIAVWDASGQSGSLSFGFVDGSKNVTITRTLTIRNYTGKTLTYKIKPTFRYANDKSNGAVKITAPTSIKLKAKQTKSITVTATITASKLRAWTLNGGSGGVNPAPLDLLEYDGYINFTWIGTKTDKDPVHVAWQVLPRKSGDVRVPGGTTVAVGDSVALQNIGAGKAAIDVYSLVGTSPDKPASRPGMNSPVIDLKSVGVQTFLVPADYCGPADSFVYRIAVSTWDRQTTAIVPGEIDAFIDVNDDGDPDFDVYSAPLSIPGLGDGRAVTFVYDYNADTTSAWFYTESGTNDSNTILTFCGDQLGLDATALGAPWKMDVIAYDWYYHDYAVTDQITGIEVAPYAEHYLGTVGSADGDIAGLSTANLTVADLSSSYAYPVNPSETGLLLVTNANRGDWIGGAPKGRESIALTVAAP